MLAKIKRLLELSDSSKDDLLQILIESAINECRNYTNNKCIKDLESCIVQMVIYNYNRLGTEGLGSENYSGLSFGYANEYPEQIMRQLKAHRKIGVI